MNGLIACRCGAQPLRTTSYECPRCHKPRRALEARIESLEELIQHCQLGTASDEMQELFNEVCGYRGAIK